MIFNISSYIKRHWFKLHFVCDMNISCFSEIACFVMVGRRLEDVRKKCKALKTRRYYSGRLVWMSILSADFNLRAGWFAHDFDTTQKASSFCSRNDLRLEFTGWTLDRLAICFQGVSSWFEQLMNKSNNLKITKLMLTYL